MYKINFYKDEQGKEPIKEYLKDLSQRTDKNSRINHNKINEYIQVLAENGKTAGAY
jgi:phage-related protein